MIPVADPFMAGVRPTGLQRGRGGFLRSADDAPYVSDPSGETVKTGDRKGEVKRLKYGSPSNRGREIENDAGLVKYKQRLSLVGIGMSDDLALACKALVDLPVGSPEFNSAADHIAVEADKLTRSSLAADRGTHGHLLCELFDRNEPFTQTHVNTGKDLGLGLQAQDDVVTAWIKLLVNNGLEILAIEASCVDDTWRLAGTLDRIVRLTRPLTFVKPGGELVTIPADTVLILDIKFGKTRKAHPIQIASYAQSVPYDTDTETRGEWPWLIDQTHALIAHGDFGDDTRPVTIELVWVDLVAGREHGGQCVVDAKAWAARDDVFSVAQIVEGVEANSRMLDLLEATQGSIGTAHATPSTLSSAGMPDPSAPLTVGEEAGAAAGHSPALTEAMTWAAHNLPKRVTYDGPWDAASNAVSTLTDATVNDLIPRQGLPQHALDELEVDRLNDARRAGYSKPVVTNAVEWEREQRLALVDARGQLCATPDEGADLSDGEFDELWDRLRTEFDALPATAKVWRRDLLQQARQRGVSFMAQEGKTERRFHINVGLVALAIVDADDEILRAILALVLGDIAWFVGIEPGHLVGSLNHVEASKFADLCDTYISPPPAA